MRLITLAGIKEFFDKGPERSVKAKKNIAASFIFKGGSILSNLAIIPLTLNYIDPTKFGIWITLISIVNWFSFFDIGLGSGLRNKYAEALANNDKVQAQKYISTTYALLIFIVTVIFLVFIILRPFINWAAILNAPEKMSQELNLLALIVFVFFCLKFVLQLINTILIADQKPALNDFNNFITNLLSMVAIYVLTITTKGSLIYLGLVVGLVSIIVLLAANLIFFSKKYIEYKPTIKSVDLSNIKVLTNTGIQFFIIQICVIITYTTDNIIISQLFSPADVVPYNIAYKYFSIIIILFTIINSPFWTAYTDAYNKGDIQWIKDIIYKLKKVWIITTIISLILLIFSNLVFTIWIGNKIHIPFILSLFMFFYVVGYNWGSIFVYFINGVGKIKLQLLFAVFASILNIPLSIFFAKYLNFGISGVILAMIICGAYGPVVAKIQYNKIIEGNALGIWNK